MSEVEAAFVEGNSGADPSAADRMRREGRAAHREARATDRCPLGSDSCDLVFISMVYHHLLPGPALGEIRRILRPGAHVMIRNPTRDSLDGFTYLRFFPEALAIDRTRMPSRDELVRACAAAGLAIRAHKIVRHLFAESHADYYRKVSLRGLSSLRLISDEAFDRGLRDLEAYCRSRERGEPIYEPVELFLFAG
jgi:SAM-dependent methyltransferase